MAKKESYFGHNSIKPPSNHQKYSNFADSTIKPSRTPLSSLSTAESSTPPPHTTSSPLYRETHPSPSNPISKALKNPRRSSLKKSKKPTKISRSPLIFIATILIAIVFIVISAFSLLGSHIQTVFNHITDPSYTSRTIRSNRIFSRMLSGKEAMPRRLQKRLTKYGIEIGSLNSHGNFTKSVPNKGSPSVLKFKDQIITSEDFLTKFKTDLEFREVYTKARYNRAINFFDSSATKTFRRLGLTRNLFDKFRQTNDHEADSKSYQKTLSNHFAGETNSRINTGEDRTTTDQNGKQTTQRVATGEDISTSSTSGDTSSVKAKNFVNNVSSRVASSAGPACASLKAGELISTTIAATETYRSMNFALALLEPLSKQKAGLGHQAPVNQVLNFFNTSTTSKVVDTSTGKTISITGTPLESEGAHVILGGVAPNRSKLKNYSLERSQHTLKSTLFQSKGADSITSCNAVQSTGAVISLATTFLPGVGVAKSLVGLLIDTAIGAGIELAIAGSLSILIPTIAKSMFSNPAEANHGIPGGEYFTSGVSALNFRLARSNSALTPASKEVLLAYNEATSDVLALESELDRKQHHPLDPSSPNTFLGSILIKFATAPASLYSLSHLATSSLSKLNPVLAKGEDTSYLTSFNDCENIDNIGAGGDLYCHAIPASDPTTFDLDPSDPTYLSVLNPNLEIADSGQTTIKKHSELANFISFCTERDSPFGIVDANILSAFESSLGTVGDNIPVIDDIIDLVNAAENQSAMPWATGAICVNSKNNPRWDNEFKYYQYFIENNRILEQLGYFEENHLTNPVTDFKATLISDLDDSDAGYLARISGLSKSNAEIILASLQEAHQPSLATSPSQKSSKSLLFFKNPLPSIISKLSSNIIFHRNYTIFTPLRHKQGITA